MSIKISELLQQPAFSAFRIAAGINGLNRSVSKVNILDFEYDALSDSEPFGLFEKEAFVLTSLLFAKHHPDMILKSIKLLIQDGASALAIKEIYYHELPNEVIEYANQQAFPILMFKREGGYFETLITELSALIEARGNEELNEQKLKLLMNEKLSAGSQRVLAEELFPNLRVPFSAAYMKNKMPPAYLREGKRFCYSYEEGSFLVGNLHSESIKEKTHPTGFSKLHDNLDEIYLALKESLFAYEYADKYKRPYAFFTDIGIFQLIYPLRDNLWVRNYCADMKSMIEKACSHEDLMQTAQAYVMAQGDVVKAAGLLHVHKNTVRYRLGRIKEALTADHEPDYFESQLMWFVLMNENIKD